MEEAWRGWDERRGLETEFLLAESDQYRGDGAPWGTTVRGEKKVKRRNGKNRAHLHFHPPKLSDAYTFSLKLYFHILAELGIHIVHKMPRDSKTLNQLHTQQL